MKGSRPWLTRSLTNFAVRTERRSLGGETAQPRYDGSCDTSYNPRIGRRLASARALRLTTDRYSCVFGEEAQSGISRMRQPAEGTRFSGQRRGRPIVKASAAQGRKYPAPLHRATPSANRPAPAPSTCRKPMERFEGLSGWPTVRSYGR